MVDSSKLNRGVLFTISILIFTAFLSSFGEAQDIPYGTGQWDADSFGNHRAVISVTELSDVIWAHIPWRRRDTEPGTKNIIVVDAQTGRKLANVFRVNINRESGDLLIQPQTVPGKYYVYYLPYLMEGRSNYPTVTYPKPEKTAVKAWLKKHSLSDDFPPKNLKDFPQASVTAFQSIDDFNSFFPMEVIATAHEVEKLLERHSASDYLLFPEDRRFPIRMTDDLPLKWIKSGPQEFLKAEAARGEFYSFQIGVFACRKEIADIQVRFSDLNHKKNLNTISSSSFQSFNTEGVNWDGREFDKVCSVGKKKVQALWCGVQIPIDAQTGDYEGRVAVRPEGMPESSINLSIHVTDLTMEDGGDSEPWRHSRLRWLNSRLGFDDDLVFPFTSIKKSGNTFSCLGRTVTVGETGFPEQIESFFSPGVTGIQNTGRQLLQSPFRLIVQTGEKENLKWKGKGLSTPLQRDGTVTWQAKSQAGPLTMDCQAQMEFDGFVQFKVRLSVSEPLSVQDIRLEIPLHKDVAKYMMGMGFKGGFRPPSYEWNWNPTNNQDSLWIGDANAGLQCSFRGENYSRPLNTNFYLSKPLNMPPSWFNGGKGGCKVSESGHVVVITAFSGQRTVQPGKDLYFHFNLLLTPFKPLDTATQWTTRFYHAFEPVAKIAETGANTINNHHANEVNPYINYPFIHTEQMKQYIEEAHRKGMKVKIYNTIRELSNRAPEIFALRSLGDEIFSRGPGGGFSWLQEHIGSDYIAAWFVPKLKDAALINSGMSRWHNYYIEGLNWLAKNIGIDGLYIDDVAFDRTTMKRVRKILDRNREGALIDLHSANQFNPRDGYASSANLYLEHFPYLNRLWFGEYFDYDSSPDYWLVEISGIPFGLMGEMLQDGGNPWRGMIYGMTSRLPWAGDPRPIWKVWDEFGIKESEMIGYWSPACPINTDSIDVPATVFIMGKTVLVALASWAPNQIDIRLNIDWKKMDIDPVRTVLRAPDIQNFQKAALFLPTDKVPMDPGKGWLLILEERIN
jgi:hypothetical protein